MKAPGFEAIVVTVSSDAGHAGCAVPQNAIGPVRIRARWFDEPDLDVHLFAAVGDEAFQLTETCFGAWTAWVSEHD